MAVYNPRFPHSFCILRPKVDAGGMPILDEQGEPIFEQLVYPVARYSPSQIPMRNADGWITDNADTFVFGYRQEAEGVSKGVVITAEMKIACPMIIGEVKTGYVLQLTDDDRTYRGEVVRKTNTSFGTNIWFNEIKQ